MNDEANEDGEQYTFGPSKSDNIFDEADDQSDEYDSLDDKEFQAIETFVFVSNHIVKNPCSNQRVQPIVTQPLPPD